MSDALPRVTAAELGGYGLGELVVRDLTLTISR